MKKSITLTSTFTVLILVLLMIPIVIPQTAVSAAVADNVTLNSLKNDSTCGAWSIPVYVRSSSSLACNMTINSNVTGFADARIQLFSLNSSAGATPIWEYIAYNAISIASAGNTVKTVSFTMPTVSQVGAGNYDIRVGAQANGADAWVYSAKNVGGIFISNTTPVAPLLNTPLDGAVAITQTPTFTWNTASGAASYTLVIDGTDNKTCIANTVASYTMTVLMTRATHTWAIKTVDVAGNSAQSTSRTICIDTTAPTLPVLLTPPNGGPVAPDYNATYTWSRSTDTSSCANIQYVVETYRNATLDPLYLVDNATVAQPPTGNPTYTVSTQIAGAVTGWYYWRVKAYDCAGLTNGYTATFSFYKPPSSTTYSIPLSAGWNLVSLPLIPASTTITDVLSATNIPGNKVVSVWYYDYGSSCSVPSWKTYRPGYTASNTLGFMEAGKAYWISCNQTGTLSGSGARPCPAVVAGAPPTLLQYQLCYNAVGDGWNMLGFKCTQNMLSADYLAGVLNKYDSLYRYAGGWVSVAASENLTPGTGYYIQMNESGKITPPCY